MDPCGLLDLAELGVTVDELDVELLSLADNRLAGLGADGVGDNASVLSVLHDEHVEVLDGVDGEVLEAIDVDVLGDAVATVTLVGHGLLGLVAAADGGVNTAGLAPAAGKAGEALVAVAGELRGALLEDSLGDDSLDHMGMQ
eukprot:GILK01011153.1.p2 GENE.GILK01011153.1~~GILK01011153.1.p2  ORF type:complete len:142 (+),score=10.92 GILK01011153.1:43-468(+)